MSLLRRSMSPLWACCVLALAACGGDDAEVAAPVGDIPPALDAVDSDVAEDAGPPADVVEEEEVVLPPEPGLGLDYESTEPGRLPRYELEGEGLSLIHI